MYVNKDFMNRWKLYYMHVIYFWYVRNWKVTDIEPTKFWEQEINYIIEVSETISIELSLMYTKFTYNTIFHTCTSYLQYFVVGEAGHQYDTSGHVDRNTTGVFPLFYHSISRSRGRLCTVYFRHAVFYERRKAANYVQPVKKWNKISFRPK